MDPDNSKLVGMMLCHTVEKCNVEPRGSYEDFLKKYPPLHASIMSLFDEMMYPGDLFESYPDDNKVGIYNILDMIYRGPGAVSLNTVVLKKIPSTT